MKKYSFVFAAIVFSGDFKALDNAANAYAPGSGKIFTETENEELGAHLTFSDANGNSVTLSPGGAIKPENNEDGSFKGWVAVDASMMANSIEITETADAPAEGGNVSNAATGNGSAEENQAG